MSASKPVKPDPRVNPVVTTPEVAAEVPLGSVKKLIKVKVPAFALVILRKTSPFKTKSLDTNEKKRSWLGVAAARSKAKAEPVFIVTAVPVMFPPAILSLSPLPTLGVIMPPAPTVTALRMLPVPLSDAFSTLIVEGNCPVVEVVVLYTSEPPVRLTGPVPNAPPVFTVNLPADTVVPPV